MRLRLAMWLIGIVLSLAFYSSLQVGAPAVGIVAHYRLVLLLLVLWRCDHGPSPYSYRPYPTLTPHTWPQYLLTYSSTYALKRVLHSYPSA